MRGVQIHEEEVNAVKKRPGKKKSLEIVCAQCGNPVWLDENKCPYCNNNLQHQFGKIRMAK
jgi:rubrerythrin